MLERIRTLLAPPVFEGDPDKTRIAGLLHVLLLLVLALGLTTLPLVALAGGSQPGILIIAGTLSALSPAMLWLLRRGHVSLISVLLVALLFVAAIASVWIVGSIRVPIASLFILCVVVAGLLIGYRGTVVVAGLSLVALLALGWAESAGLLPSFSQGREEFTPWWTLASLIVGTAVLVSLATRGLQDALERARRSESALTEANRRLKAEIAERMRAEEALRSSAEGHRRVVQNANEAIFVLQEGKFKLYNRKALEITGYSKDELPSQDFAELIHPDDRESVLELHRRTIAGEQTPAASEFRIVDKGGQARWIEIRVVVIDWGDNPATLNFASDITERKRSERERQVLQNLAWELTAPLTLKELVRVLAAHCRTLFSHDSFRFDLYDEQDPVRVPVYAEDTPVGGLEPVDLERDGEDSRRPQIIRSVFDGKAVLVNREEGPVTDSLSPWGFAGRRSLSMMFVPVRWQGRCMGVIYTHSYTAQRYNDQDLALLQLLADQCGAALARVQSDEALRQSEATTRSLLQDLESSLQELKQTQAQLVQAQKMEAIGRLAGGVAHDFNNLLTSIMGYADLLLKELPADDQGHADVQEIRKSAQRAATLTRQLLAFSRKQVLEPQILDLNIVINDMEEMLRRLIGEDVEMATVLPSGLGRMQADRGQIEQVIMNLVVNARDAMPHGGKVTIETANVDLDEAYARQHVDAQPGRYVMLAVSDTGIGMDRDTQAHLFEPFFTTKERGKGTGLGLPTVYGIVKQSGGSIYVYSEPDRGTTVKVYLPQVEGEPQAPGTPAAPSTTLSKGSETILLVEDESIVAGLAKRILCQSGYTVLEAGDAAEAIQLCEQHQSPIHLLLTDVVLPGAMSGPDLARHLVGSRPETRVLYVSGYTDNAIVHHGVLDPGVAFLQKPFTPETLARKVRQVLDAPLIPDA